MSQIYGNALPGLSILLAFFFMISIFHEPVYADFANTTKDTSMTSNAFEGGGDIATGIAGGGSAENISSIGLAGGGKATQGSQVNNQQFPPTLWNPGQLKIPRIVADSSTVRQDQKRITVEMVVTNTGDTPVDLDKVELDFNHSTAGDVTSEYSQNWSNARSQLGPHESDTFLIKVKVDRDATTGPVEIDGSVQGSDAHSGRDASIYRARSTDTWLVESLTILNVNEVTPDPDSGGEWFEIYNPNSSSVDFSGWELRDDDGSVHSIDSTTTDDGDIQIASDSVAVSELSTNIIANSGDTVFLFDDRGIKTDTFVTLNASSGQSFSAFPDGSDTVEESTFLRQTRGRYNRGVEIQGPFATYTDSAQVTLELRSPAANPIPSNNTDSFTVSVTGSASLVTSAETGTYISGSGNSVEYQVSNGKLVFDVTDSVDELITLSLEDSQNIYTTLSDTDTIRFTGKVLLNEFMPDPEGIDHDADGIKTDGDEEYVQVFNTTSDTVDVNHWEINETSGGDETILNGKIPPRGFLIHWANNEQYIHDGDGDTVNHFTGVNPLGSINNSGETIQLRTPKQVVLDEKEYGGSSPNQSWALKLDGWEEGTSWINDAPTHAGPTNDTNIEGPANGTIKYPFLPDTVTANQSFASTLIAADPNGDTVTSFDTDIDLGVSPGSVTPNTLSFSSGEFNGSLTISINDSAPVTLSGTYAVTTRGTAPLQVQYPTIDSGSLQVTDNADTLSQSDLNGSDTLLNGVGHTVRIAVEAADTVSLYHRNDGTLATISDTKISLNNTSKDTWIDTIPQSNFAPGDDLNFIIEAKDGTGNSVVQDSGGQGFQYAIKSGEPTVRLLEPDTGDLKSMDVPGTYVITEPNSQAGTISMEVSDDSGSSWDTEATITGEVASVNTSQNGETHTFTWDSLVDIGNVFDTQVKLRIRATDGIETGPYFVSGAFTVDNRAPPRIDNLSSTASIDPPDTGAYINWLFSSDDFQFFRIYRSEQTSDSSQATVIDTTATLNADTGIYFDSSVTRGDSYFYYVTAVDTVGIESDSSNLTTPSYVTIVKTENSLGSYRPGDTITYDLSYTNQGFGTTGKIEVLDVVPDGTTIIVPAEFLSGPVGNIEYKVGGTYQSTFDSSASSVRWIIKTDIDPQEKLNPPSGKLRMKVEID